MMEDDVKKYIYIHIYICLGHFAVQWKLTEHCKSTVIEKIKILNEKYNRYSSSRETSKYFPDMCMRPWYELDTNAFKGIKEKENTNINTKNTREFLLWLSGLRTHTVSMRIQVLSLDLISGLRIQGCSVGCRCGISLSCSSDLTPSLGRGVAIKRKKKKY